MMKQMAWTPALLVGGLGVLLLVILTIRKKKAQNKDEVDYNYSTVAAKEAEVVMGKEERGKPTLRFRNRRILLHTQRFSVSKRYFLSQCTSLF